MKPPKLGVLIVAGRDADAKFCSRVLEDHGDRAAIAPDVPDALARLTREHFDLALVSLSLPRGDGLALVHHIRALYPHIDVVVMAAPSEIEETAHAMALGVLANVMLPLTGDAILVAADRARERRVLVAERSRLYRQEAASRRRNATYARCAAFVSEMDPGSVAMSVLDACVAEIPARAAAIYVPDVLGASRFTRVAALGSSEELPRQLDSSTVSALDPTRAVHMDRQRVRVVMLGDMDVSGVVDLLPNETFKLDEDAREALHIIAALGTAAFSASRKVEAIARTGIKDPETSAYTFAYFGDVAGREIDRALRHERRFALLTLALDGIEEAKIALDSGEMVQLRRAIADAVLEAVRDSDVLARVEDDEFYLLLPETGLLGALMCRRRILERIGAVPEVQRLRPRPGLEPIVGISVYPADGSDLGRLLRASRRRSERSRRGVWRKLGLGECPFWHAIERLVGTESDTKLQRDGTLTLHPDLLRTHDDAALARHAPMPTSLIAQIGSVIASDAVRHRVPGTLYASGDAMLAESVTRAIQDAGDLTLRAWILGRPSAATGSATRLRLPLNDPRLDERILLLSLTELGGYMLAARPLGKGMHVVYHASDLDLVDGLVTSLQNTYHLQPEVRW